jgi:hypothetical protein
MLVRATLEEKCFGRENPEDGEKWRSRSLDTKLTKDTKASEPSAAKPQ